MNSGLFSPPGSVIPEPIRSLSVAAPQKLSQNPFS